MLQIMTEPANNTRTTGPALEAMYRVLLWLIPTVEKFPRKQKFVLGDRIENTALELLRAFFTRRIPSVHCDINIFYPCASVCICGFIFLYRNYDFVWS